MQKTKKITTTQTKEVIADVICNICKKTCASGKRKGYKHGQEEYTGLIETVVSGGYFSEVVGDMTCWRFSICEYCLQDKVFPLFKIPHETRIQGISEFVTPKKLKAILDKRDRESKKEFIQEILKIKPEYKKNALQKKSGKVLSQLYHDLIRKQIESKRK